jgi:hypothetical protein
MGQLHGGDRTHVFDAEIGKAGIVAVPDLEICQVQFAGSGLELEDNTFTLRKRNHGAPTTGCGKWAVVSILALVKPGAGNGKTTNLG